MFIIEIWQKIISGMTKSKYQIESEALYKEVCRLALEETNWSFEKEQVLKNVDSFC